MLFGLRQALDLLFEEGMENAFRRHHLLAEATRRAVEVWAEGQALNFNIIAPQERSDTVSVVLTNGFDPDAMRAWCRENCGVVLGHGIGELSGKAFRVAHMGHVNAPMVLGMLSVIEMALAAMGIPHGSGGVHAAITWLARQVRDT
ncbi:MAG: alanine-glyoxylate transaminase / serine-glyoxylate transaminase / serine-pyruvate transaminase [Mycobacterium sp.]|nr:alanine-glyoxylate transaminase / serine-glyoxylate transaminase / serine-pyruvate transaminase [Mycobacterium sp.]